MPVHASERRLSQGHCTALLKPEHAHVAPIPVRQRLRPDCLGIGRAGRTHYGNEDLGRAYRARDRIGNRHQLAGVVDERLVPDRMLPAASRLSRRACGAQLLAQ
jgi:hypothetical protein